MEIKCNNCKNLVLYPSDSSNKNISKICLKNQCYGGEECCYFKDKLKINEDMFMLSFAYVFGGIVYFLMTSSIVLEWLYIVGILHHNNEIIVHTIIPYFIEGGVYLFNIFSYILIVIIIEKNRKVKKE